jgi:hypothetical protein
MKTGAVFDALSLARSGEIDKPVEKSMIKYLQIGNDQ